MLNRIKDNSGARKKFKRIGRGIGCGKGKTSGRGGKGQTARSGVALNGFEGGQNPLFRRLPKRGFHNYNNIKFEVLNLSDIQNLIDCGKLLSDSISLANLKEIGAIKGKKSLVKLLGTGQLKQKISIEVNAISNKSNNKLQENGSNAIIINFSRNEDNAAEVKRSKGKKAKRIEAAIAKKQSRMKSL